MEIKVLENKKTRFVAEISGVGHTFCNALVSELWNDKDVTAAAYSIDHPFVGVPKLVLETKSKSPKDVLKDASKRIQKNSESFAKTFAKMK
ncbi:DNA-directed RNA polymerase subunit L [Candidatus Woesearchaeota archaeon]|nr:DNA-directed RNA polymerase subunit L [Candidatus Woesearchaeota archaeon]